MSETPRPTLKLKVKKTPGEPQQPPPPPPPPSEPSQPKIKLKIPQKQSEEKKKENGDELQKPSKKRPADGPVPDENEGTASAVSQEQQSAGPKRLKLNPSRKPGLQSIRIRNKGLVPTRPIGVGYDSEASDTEVDPSIEEQFIIRMLPGEDCDYLQQAINERRFDRGEFGFKPLDREGRRAIFKIRTKQYAAALVDLPCIVEGMKSWDRRGWYKSADISQMLLVLGPVNNESEALEYPLPRDVECPDDKTLQYAHGLTPPLRWVRRRRFRDRISTRTIEQVERAVEDLIAQDEASFGSSLYELLDSAKVTRSEGVVQSANYDETYDYEQDAEGEVEEEMPDGAGVDENEDALAAEMEAALAAGAEDGAPADAELAGPSVPQLYQAGTPSAAKPTTPGETSGDESAESESDEPEAPEELDDEQLEQQQQLQQQQEEIAELESLVRTETARWEGMQNAILKNKLGKRIHELKQALDLKKVSAGQGNEIS